MESFSVCYINDDTEVKAEVWYGSLCVTQVIQTEGGSFKIWAGLSNSYSLETVNEAIKWYEKRLRYNAKRLLERPYLHSMSYDSRDILMWDSIERAESILFNLRLIEALRISVSIVVRYPEKVTGFYILVKDKEN